MWRRRPGAGRDARGEDGGARAAGRRRQRRSARAEAGPLEERAGRGAARPWWTLGLALTSLADLLAGLLVPVLRYERLVRGTADYSVLSGIRELFVAGHLLTAGLVLGFSVCFPLAKLLVVIWIGFRRPARGRSERWLERLLALGKWSMLDVFAVAVTAGAVQLGVLAEARPLPGVYVFAAGILGSMASTLAMRARVREAAIP